MQHDEMIWQGINHQFCSYKSTMAKSKGANRDKKQFCKHPYSTTGLCNRSSCPLANSKYATVREENGRIHLYIKTVERAHSPKNLWEKIYLSRNYTKALAQLDEHLAFFPKAQIHRNKQRLTKIHQYLLRMRKLKLREINGRKAKLTRVHRKVEQREERREKKALVAAKIESNIEKELVERLAKGTYGDIYNFPEVPYQKALQSAIEKTEEMEQEEESEDELDTDEEESEDEDGMMEYVEDLDEEAESDLEDFEMDESSGNVWGDDESSSGDEDSDSDDDSSSEDSGSDDGSSESGHDKKAKSKPDKKKKGKPQPPRRRGPRIEIEYENEEENDGVAESVGDAGLAW
mmetsp:Transcript_19452/g.44548  ORF Transcript_19452/g.44548 Transcript_19452/m.44548 type:complete len:347 (+) Transcript_19452:81-1121(+)